jgi:alkyl hydroperoxide reductase subunit AhpF
MPFLNDQDATIVRNRFAKDLSHPVSMEFFAPSIGGLVLPGQETELADYTRQILTEVASLSPNLTLNVHSLVAEPEAAQKLGITRTPATAVIGAQDFGIRYYGIPGGYEFATLLDLIIAVSQANPPIAPETRGILRRLKSDARIQVFVTPT